LGFLLENKSAMNEEDFLTADKSISMQSNALDLDFITFMTSHVAAMLITTTALNLIWMYFQ